MLLLLLKDKVTFKSKYYKTQRIILCERANWLQHNSASFRIDVQRYGVAVITQGRFVFAFPNTSSKQNSPDVFK